MNADTVKTFYAGLKDRFNDAGSGLGKAQLRLPVDEIEFDGKEMLVRGSHRRLANAIGSVQKPKLSGVPRFVKHNWRARQDESGHWSEILTLP